MITTLIKKVLASVIGRWVTASVVTLLLGGAVLKWHNFKEDLIHKGQQVCVQEINKQTVIDLENALAAERVVNAALVVEAEKTAAVNEEARARLRDSESKVNSLLNERKSQEKNDETYAEWSNTPLADGVAERMRNQRTGSDTNTVRENGN